MFTKDQLLSAAKRAGITVTQTPEGKDSAFVSNDGSRYPIADATFDDSDFYYIYNKSDIAEWSNEDASVRTKYDNKALTDSLHEDNNEYKDFPKQESHNHEVLFDCVNM